MHIESITIATTNTEEMVTFYSNIFDIEFSSIEMYGGTLYSGMWGEIKLLFCPAEIAQNTSTQNRQQFDIIVEDLTHSLKIAQQYGGTLMRDIRETEAERSVGVYDPDKNSMVLKQYK